VIKELMIVYTDIGVKPINAPYNILYQEGNKLLMKCLKTCHFFY